MEAKRPYEAPRVVDERVCETEARACNKTPGHGFSNLPNFCGPVWLGMTGNSGSGCYFNPDARSS